MDRWGLDAAAWLFLCQRIVRFMFFTPNLLISYEYTHTFLSCLLVSARADALAGPERACCAPHKTPGCYDAPIRTCVCKISPECCNGEWDQDCVDAVGKLDCGRCPVFEWRDR